MSKRKWLIWIEKASGEYDPGWITLFARKVEQIDFRTLVVDGNELETDEKIISIHQWRGENYIKVQDNDRNR